MADLLLRETEQSAVRAVIASQAFPAGEPLDARVLQDLARLVPCDAMGIAVLDASGTEVVDEGFHLRGRLSEDALSAAGHLGIQYRDRAVAGQRAGATRGVAVLSLGVGGSNDRVVTVWLVRRSSDFTPRDRALFRLVAPALERLLRGRSASSLPPSLTDQERRVLLHLAGGLSNSAIAERLGIAPSTVRKHLENAYRKLGVTNRLAAVRALDGAPPAEPAGRHLTGTVV